jgi:hypothetical protein
VSEKQKYFGFSEPQPIFGFAKVKENNRHFSPFPSSFSTILCIFVAEGLKIFPEWTHASSPHR